MQSGRGKAGSWVLEYISDSSKNPESLMGWITSDDTLDQVRINFDSLENAIAFAEKKGWHYTINSTNVRKIKPRNYVDNFKYIPHEDS